MSKLKVGICGFGIVGKRRRICVDRHPDLKMAGICDQSFADKKSMVDGLDGYKSYKDLLKIDLDILIVCKIFRNQFFKKPFSWEVVTFNISPNNTIPIRG